MTSARLRDSTMSHSTYVEPSLSTEREHFFCSYQKSQFATYIIFYVLDKKLKKNYFVFINTLLAY